MEAARSPWPTLGVLLIRDGLVSPEELEEVLAERADDPEGRISSLRLGEVLVERGLVTSAAVARLVAEQHELPFVDLEEPDSMVPLAVRIPEELARRHSALPIRIFPDGSLLVVVADPTEASCYDEIRDVVGVPIRFAVAAPDAIHAAIEAAGADHGFRGAVVAPPPPTSAAGSDAEPPVTTSERAPGPSPAREGRPNDACPVLGSLLLRDGLVTESQLETALAQQRLSATRRLGEILVQRGALTEMQVARALAEQHELPFVDLQEHELDLDAATRLPSPLARAYGALPVAFLPDGSLLVAVADPTSAVQSDDLRAALDGAFQLAVASPGDLAAAIATVEGLEAGPPEPLVDAAPELTLVVGGPDPTAAVTREIEAVLALGASAVHVVSGPDGLMLRARIDDVLTEPVTVSDSEPESTMAALAKLAGLGRVAFTVGERTVELRGAVLPTVLGARVTFRVVEDDVPSEPFVDLFAASGAAATVQDALEGRDGLLVICSPTSAGRAALFHSALHRLAVPGRTVLSVEDAVELLVPGVDQAEVDPRTGVTFATGLHTILRSDADVAAVGELLDAETVRLAIRGAGDRCLVVSTIAAETAASGARRLLDLGAEPAALAGALSCVVAGRRLRAVCVECRTSSYATPEELTLLGRPQEEAAGHRLLARAPVHDDGCESCTGTGQGGWAHVSEVLPLTEDVRRLVAAGASAAEIETAAVAAGMTTLFDAAVDLCLEGVVTVSELAPLSRRPV